MSNYTQNVSYGPKDALTTGDAAKRIKGVEIDAEFAEIATAISSKEDAANKGVASGYASLDASVLVPSAQLPAATDAAKGAVELATTAEVVTGTDTTRAVTAAGVEAWAAQNGGMVQDISNLSDPGADRLLGWDDSLGAAIGFTLGSQLAFSGSTVICTVDLTNLSATNLTSGTIPNARIAVTGVTQHQASLSIAETQIADGAVFPRIGTAETITAAWVFSGTGAITRSGQGVHPYLVGSGNTGGAITLSTSAASGTPGAGDIWIQYTA